MNLTNETEKSFQIECLSHIILGEELWLLPQKAIFKPFGSTLILADLHLGKSTHFRQKGLNVPKDVLYEDLETLDLLIERYSVKRLLILGDLFHAAENSEWQIFGDWLQSKNVSTELVKGNHDRLAAASYSKFNIKVHEQDLHEGSFIYTHHPLKDFTGDKFVISGHIHPAIVLKGKAYQNIKLECFYFSKYQALLPAFGRFTGNEIILRKKHDDVFVIVGNTIKKI